MMSRRSRILIIGAIVTIGVLGVIIMDAPEPTRTIDEVMESPESLTGREIAIRGEVRDGTIDNETSTFVIHGADAEIVLDFSQATVSNGLGDNRTVYAEGELVKIDGSYVFEAKIIKTSCPSKYEDEAHAEATS